MAYPIEIASEADSSNELKLTVPTSMDHDLDVWVTLDDFLTMARSFGLAVIKLPDAR